MRAFVGDSTITRFLAVAAPRRVGFALLPPLVEREAVFVDVALFFAAAERAPRALPLAARRKTVAVAARPARPVFAAELAPATPAVRLPRVPGEAVVVWAVFFSVMSGSPSIATDGSQNAPEGIVFAAKVRLRPHR
ncbi:MAG: hypothetical protein ACR2PL_24035 [Dehalococcoidia bacterium]